MCSLDLVPSGRTVVRVLGGVGCSMMDYGGCRLCDTMLRVEVLYKDEDTVLGLHISGVEIDAKERKYSNCLYRGVIPIRGTAGLPIKDKYN